MYVNIMIQRVYASYHGGGIVGNLDKDTPTYLEFDISKLELIGQGYQGKVYLLPENKVIKIFHDSYACTSQLEILQKGKLSEFFPKVYDFNEHSIIMDFVHGINLSDYLEHHNLSKPICIELVKLIDEFKSLKFTRLDMRTGHIFVQANETIKIIDPRDSFKIVQPYPFLMMRGLRRHGVLEDFFNNIKLDYPDYYSYWSNEMFKK